MSWKLEENCEFMGNCPHIEILEAEEQEYDAFVSRESKSIKHVSKSKKIKKKKVSKKQDQPKEEEVKEFEPIIDKWLELGVPTQLAESLSRAGFNDPTPVQKECLEELIKLKNDSFIAAETGSGKTLAYIIPILIRCLQIKAESSEDLSKSLKLRCIVVTPTRELAIQVKNMANRVSKRLDIHCVDIIGGMSEIKQERKLSKRPQIICCTPGRLWTYINQYPHPHLHDLSGFKLLVIDEVDRMTEQGHFYQLKNIIDFLRQKTSKKFTIYMASATLSLQKTASKYKSKKNETTFEKISSFLSISSDFKIYDFSRHSYTPDSLKEYRICCDKKQINANLYYLLLNSKKTIIFVNTVKTSDWLNIFLSCFDLDVLRLNSRMEQKNRLKLYDRFASTDSILLATDVAARGLDIPNVNMVIHYDVPTNPDIYVHRSGRTARRFLPGSSILLVVPESLSKYQSIITTLNRNSDLPDYNIDSTALGRLYSVVDRATHIADNLYKISKLESEHNWFKEKSAKSETVFDPDFGKSKHIDIQNLNFLKKRFIQQQKQLKQHVKSLK